MTSLIDISITLPSTSFSWLGVRPIVSLHLLSLYSLSCLSPVISGVANVVFRPLVGGLVGRYLSIPVSLFSSSVIDIARKIMAVL